MNVLKGLMGLGLGVLLVLALLEGRKEAAKIQELGPEEEQVEPEPPQKVIKVFREDKVLLVPWSRKSVPYALK